MEKNSESIPDREEIAGVEEDYDASLRAYLPAESCVRVIEYSDASVYEGECRHELRPPVDTTSRFREHDEYPTIDEWKHPLECGRIIVSVKTQMGEDITESCGKSTVFVRHGVGKFTFPNGDAWNGEHKYCYFHGKGTHTHTSKTKLSGYWAWDEIELDSAGSDPETQRTRPVVLKYANGDEYKGRLRAQDGVFDDLVEATYTHRNGTEFRGQWSAGRFTGHGRIKYPCGYTVKGEFLNGLPHGDDCTELGSQVPGLSKGENGSGIIGEPGAPYFKYHGPMFEGLRHGLNGTLHFAGGMSWTGEFNHGTPVGGNLAFSRLGTNQRRLPSYPLRNDMFSYLNITPPHRGIALLLPYKS